MRLETLSTIIGLAILAPGPAFADEPPSRETTSARSDAHAKATGSSSADSGRLVQHPLDQQQAGAAGDVRGGKLASERSRPHGGTKPRAGSHPVPQAPRTSQGIESRTAQTQAIAPNATGLSQLGSRNLYGATKNEPKNINQPHLPAASSVLRSSSPLPVNGFHLSNVGGPTRSAANSSAVINGTGFKHRP